MKKKVIYAAIAAVAIGGAGWLILARSAAQPSSAREAPAVSVSTTTVLRQDVPVSLEAIGTVASLNVVDVRPQTSNTVATVHIKEGQFVRKGDLLFSLDDRADRANLEKALAQLQRDQATLGDLERQLKRSQEQVAKNFISQSSLDTVFSQVEAQRAALQSDRAAIHSAEVALSYDTIRSPLNGRAGGIAIFAGSLAQPSTTLVTIAQIDPIAISFTLPEAQLQRVLAASRKGAVPVNAIVPGAKAPLQGKLNFIDNTVDPTAGTVRAKATFANPEMSLWPGQYVTSRINVGAIEGALVVPQAAVITNTTGKVIYLVDASGSAQLKKIDVVHEFDGNAVVMGVAEGDRVVVEGKQNLRPGQKVREGQAAGAPARDGGAKKPAAGAAAEAEKRP